MRLQFPHQPNRSFEDQHDPARLARAVSREAGLA
jgi:hypothetical protein